MPRSPRVDEDDDLLRLGLEKDECPIDSPTTLFGHESDSSALIHRFRAVDVCEVFSPYRLGGEAAKFGMGVGDSMDRTTEWDFNLADHRRQAESYVDRLNPLVLIGSPPCVAFSQFQSVVRESDRKAQQEEVPVVDTDNVVVQTHPCGPDWRIADPFIYLFQQPFLAARG